MVPPKHLLCSQPLPFPEEIRAETRDPQKSPGWAAQEKQGCQQLWSTSVWALWHQGDAASSTALSQCQTSAAFSGNEFSPCLVSRANKPGSVVPSHSFAALVPFYHPTEWLGSRLNCPCYRDGDVPCCQRNSVLMGMGHPNPVGITAHHPEAGEHLDPEESSFQQSLG